MKIIHIIIGICSLLFFMIGFDKFLFFLDPPCSLTSQIPSSIWKTLGALQITGGVLIWIPKLRKYVASFFFAFMLFFTIYHVTQGTYDIGGAVFMAIMLALLMWTPNVLKGKTK